MRLIGFDIKVRGNNVLWPKLITCQHPKCARSKVFVFLTQFCLPMMALLLVHNRINIAVFEIFQIFEMFYLILSLILPGWEIWFNISSRGVFWRTSWKSWLMDGKLSCVHFFRWQETIWAQISLHTTEHQPNNSFAQIWTMHIYILLHVWKKKIMR